jgi:hypothetical protein
MSSEAVRTQARDRVLIDVVRQSPVDRTLERKRRRHFWLLLLALVFLIVLGLVWRFNADRPVDYDAATDHFKYGSIGSEPGGSLTEAAGGFLPPYPIFKVMPKVCPDKLPNGYTGLGLLVEQGKDLPIGVSQRFRLGIDQVGLNCAFCHTGTVRDTTDSAPRIILGMPAHQLDLQSFFRFLVDCTLDERFSPDNLLGLIEQEGIDLSWLDQLLYRFVVIPRTREQTLQLARRLDLIMGDRVTEWGPGRVDTFNAYKGVQLKWRLGDLPLSELIAASDFPSLWNQKPRDGMHLHWDGNNDSLDERNRSASLGAGATPVTIDHERLAGVRAWIWDLPPPPYPYRIDESEAKRGNELYRTYCFDCHADHRFKDGVVEGSRVGSVEAIDVIGTDPYRLNSYTYELAANQYTLYPDPKYRFTRFRKTNGYANHPLDGIWARAPYLHNGAVPTLRDLLEPPQLRPKRFYRGYDVYDPDKVGFVSDVAEEGGVRFFLFDTALPGNGNDGHVYAVRLPDEDKDAIVEYMKTL